jgi:hypothetical protein
VNIQNKYVIACLFGITMFASVDTLGQEAGDRKIVNPYESIEKKASVATPEDPNSIQSLADEIFNFPRFFPRMPDQLESMVKARLVNAEILYRQGKKTGIHEETLVKTLNDLSDRLGGPSHLRTTLSQMRILRMGLALSEPRFMGSGVARQDTAIGTPISPIMGPLQATHLVVTLINQKFSNPDFQVSPQEWEEVSRQRVSEEILAAQARLTEVQANPPGRRVGTLKSRSYSSEKRRELDELLSRNISSLTEKDGIGLINHALATLGID